MSDIITRRMLETARKLELHAFWDDPDSPSGIAAALVLMPEDENEPGIFAAVRVRDAETAFKLEELLEERALAPA